MGKKQQQAVRPATPGIVGHVPGVDDMLPENVDVGLDAIDLTLASEMNGPAPTIPPGHILVPARLVRTVTIECPVGDLNSGHYVSRHVEVQLNHEQSIALKQLSHGLEAAASKLASGRVVVNAADAVRWLLERVAEEREGVAT